MVGRELLVGLPAGAGSDCGGFVSGLVEVLEDGVGELGDVGAVPLDDELGSAGLSLGHGAGLAGVLIRWRGWEPLGLKKLCDLTLDGLRCEGGDVAAEVLYGEEEALILNNSDADDVQFRIEKIGAVDRGCHPDLVEVGGSLSVCGDVFRDGAEAGSCVGSAGDEVGFAGILVAKLAGVADDPAEVIAGGDGEGAVPAQGREVVLGPSLIGELQESLLVRRGVGHAVGLGGDCGRRCDGYGRQNEEQEQRSCFAFAMHAY